ncbi:replication initiator protein [Blackfly microvirus SF02]|uniref:Replication initiator protein n=1 Tax=Blackfly microvirus SF02 TaxID=2576452 RepID=A0A4P8PT89_9VIRU|nr:replication initiator protein [Blackfly microvirus SF02]
MARICLGISCVVVSGYSMPCFGPLTAYHGKHVNPLTGKRSLVFKLSLSFDGLRLQVPCGRCIGCRLERSRLWAIRCMHEKRMHLESAFVTLTYANKHLPSGSTLVVRDVQLFLKKLRKKRPSGLRFFACGEYGERTKRPHYHFLFFNTRFPDQRFYKQSDSGSPLFRSAELSELWSVGDNYVGGVTFDSCCYVAGYCTKVVRGDKAAAHYGERIPEFCLMSRRPGIGRGWFDAFHREAYAHDSAVMNEREVGLPRYYDNLFESIDSDRLAELKIARRERANLKYLDSVPKRLRVRERFEELKYARFAREP